MDQYGQAVIDVLLFFTRALRHGPVPVEVSTNEAGPYLRVLDELVPQVVHVTEQYANNRVEAAGWAPPRRRGCRRARLAGRGQHGVGVAAARRVAAGAAAGRAELAAVPPWRGPPKPDACRVTRGRQTRDGRLEADAPA